MQPNLSALLAEDRARDLRAAAERHRLAREVQRRRSLVELVAASVRWIVRPRSGAENVAQLRQPLGHDGAVHPNKHH
jgi:hypothetical protein